MESTLVEIVFFLVQERMVGPILTFGLILKLVLPVERILCQIKIAEIGALARVF